MEQELVERFAFENLPRNICALTGNPVETPTIMHRDLSDWWPSSLWDMRDERLVNLLIVDKTARENYYAKLKRTGVVIALSGGLDSTTLLHWCAQIFGSVHCLMFDYGQRHKVELEFAERYLRTSILEDTFEAKITFAEVNMSPIQKLAESSLTRDDLDVPEHRNLEEMSECIPSTFVPGRNIYFITALAQLAYLLGWRHIAMGINVLDYSGYPDCRPEFIEPMRKALSVGVFNGADIVIHTPLMNLNKKSIIRLGLHLGVDYGETHSCYNGYPGGCGKCDSCILRRRAFRDLGLEDPSIERHQISE